jgi:GNAT superfamily N-acetyltransferase
MIRKACKEDVPTLVHMGKEMHLESSYASLDYSESKVSDFILYMMEYGVVLVEDKAGEVIGAVIGYTYQPYFSNALIATDAALFVTKAHRGGMAAVKLIKGFTDWAKDQGVSQIRPGISVGGDVNGVTKLYERLGYQTVGAVFMKEI